MNRALQIFKKELREMLRDKRVFYAALVGPIFLVVLMVQLMGFLQTSLSAPKSQLVHYVKPSYDSLTLRTLEKADRIKLVELKTEELGLKMVDEGRASVFLKFPKSAPDADKPEVVSAIFDEEETKSQIVLGLVSKAVAKISAERLAQVFAESNISPESATPILVKPEPIRRDEKGMGGFLAGFLPYLIVIWAFYGGFSMASEVVAGEKEKQTLETLLISPVSRRDIALGKFLSLFTVGTTSSLSSMIAVLVMGLLGGPAAKIMMPNGFSLSAPTILAMLLVILPLAAMFAGLLLAVSAYSRNTRECQTYLSLLSFVVIMPAVFSQIIGLTDFAKAKWVLFVPVLNTATVLRDALLGRLDWGAVAITFGFSALLAALAIAWAVRMFEREEILIRV